MCTILWMAGEVTGDEETEDICTSSVILLFHYLKRYCISWSECVNAYDKITAWPS